MQLKNSQAIALHRYYGCRCNISPERTWGANTGFSNTLSSFVRWWFSLSPSPLSRWPPSFFYCRCFRLLCRSRLYCQNTSIVLFLAIFHGVSFVSACFYFTSYCFCFACDSHSTRLGYAARPAYIQLSNCRRLGCSRRPSNFRDYWYTVTTHLSSRSVFTATTVW